MLAPGESLTDHLAKLEESNAPAAGRRRAESDETMQVPPGSGLRAHRRVHLGPRRRPHQRAAAARGVGRCPGGPRPDAGGTVVTSPAARRRAKLETAVATVRDSHRAGGRHGPGLAAPAAADRRWRRAGRRARAGPGLLDGRPGRHRRPRRPRSTTRPRRRRSRAFATQEYNDRGISVQVPKGWTRRASGSWVDYADPQDAGTRCASWWRSRPARPPRSSAIAEDGAEQPVDELPEALPPGRPEATPRSPAGTAPCWNTPAAPATTAGTACGARW